MSLHSYKHHPYVLVSLTKELGERIIKFSDSVILSPPNIFRTCSELFLHQLIGFPTSALLTLNFCADLRALQAGKWPRGRGKLWAGVWAWLFMTHAVAVTGRMGILCKQEHPEGLCIQGCACEPISLLQLLWPEMDCRYSGSQ